MKTFLRIPLSLAAAAMLGIGCGASDEDTQPQVKLGDEERISAEINRIGGEAAVEWWRVRKALKKYENADVAIADGYINFQVCEADGSGAMGVHFLNLGLMQDLVSDPYQPEILLYFPDAEQPGGYRLAAVEYWQAAFGQPTPSILGQSFDGPMEGHGGEMPVHFDLHVWLYKYNSSGLFAQYNPRAKCPAP
jgi:hypothetical protein